MLKQYLKNLLVGFAISFIGSITLGYLNVVGLQIYQPTDYIPLINYLLGVALIEIGVIYITLKGASKLAFHPKWKKAISVFSIFFLFGLAYTFFNYQPNRLHQRPEMFTFFKDFPFLIGLLLSAVNFSQFPFWFSWNLYLINQKYVDTAKKTIPLYLLGASIGTFLGMLSLIIGVHKTINYTQTTSTVFNYLWVVFLGLALFQLFNLQRLNTNNG